MYIYLFLIVEKKKKEKSMKMKVALYNLRQNLVKQALVSNNVGVRIGIDGWIKFVSEFSPFLRATYVKFPFLRYLLLCYYIKHTHV